MSAALRLERRVRKDNEVAHVPGIVRGFKAIDQGAALKRHAPDVCFNLRVCLQALNRHGQSEFHDIAALPFPLQVSVAMGFLDGSDGSFIHLQLRLSAPAWQAQVESKFCLPLRLDRQLHLSIPRVLGRLPERDLDALDG